MTDAEIIQTQQRELNELRTTSERAALSAGLATAIQATGHTLNPGAAPQLQKILADDVRVNRDTDGSLKLTGPGFQDVNTWVKDRLATPEFAHFLRSGSAPAGQARPGAAAPPFGQTGPLEQPKTLSDAVLIQMRMNGVDSSRDGRMDPGVSFGLKPPRR